MSELDELRAAYKDAMLNLSETPDTAFFLDPVEAMVKALKQALQERDSRIAAWQDVWTTTAAARDAARAEVTRLEAENERLEALLAAAEEVLVFADGCVLSTNQKYGDYPFVLADLYAEDYEPAQAALRRAGCHARGKFLAHQDQEPTP